MSAKKRCASREATRHRPNAAAAKPKRQPAAESAAPPPCDAAAVFEYKPAEAISTEPSKHRLVACVEWSKNHDDGTLQRAANGVPVKQIRCGLRRNAVVKIHARAAVTGVLYVQLIHTATKVAVTPRVPAVRLTKPKTSLWAIFTPYLGKINSYDKYQSFFTLVVSSDDFHHADHFDFYRERNTITASRGSLGAKRARKVQQQQQQQARRHLDDDNLVETETEVEDESQHDEVEAMEEEMKMPSSRFTSEVVATPANFAAEAAVAAAAAAAPPASPARAQSPSTGSSCGSSAEDAMGECADAGAVAPAGGVVTPALRSYFGSFGVGAGAAAAAAGALCGEAFDSVESIFDFAPALQDDSGSAPFAATTLPQQLQLQLQQPLELTLSKATAAAPAAAALQPARQLLVEQAAPLLVMPVVVDVVPLGHELGTAPQLAAAATSGSSSGSSSNSPGLPVASGSDLSESALEDDHAGWTWHLENLEQDPVFFHDTAPYELCL